MRKWTTLLSLVCLNGNGVWGVDGKSTGGPREAMGVKFLKRIKKKKRRGTVFGTRGFGCEKGQERGPPCEWSRGVV